MRNQQKAEVYISASIEVKLFDDADVIVTSGEDHSPNNPEDDLGMWS
jgi:hypothetical protein